MNTWTFADLRRLDLEYAEQGVPLHQRALRAAMELTPNFSMGGTGDPQIKRITDAFAQVRPDANSSWPGMGVGLAASVDRVQKVVVPVVYGAMGIVPWRDLGFQTNADWWTWCREDRAIAAESLFALADLFDFTYGLDDLRDSKPAAVELWRMAASNLGDAANALPTVFSVDSILQPICMVAELSLKASLVSGGADPKSFKGPKGHAISALADRMGAELPHRDDPLVKIVVSKLPAYVASRYRSAGLSRLDVVKLALGVQFVAASSMRRHSVRDTAAKMEEGGWPGPRPAPFA